MPFDTTWKDLGLNSLVLSVDTFNITCWKHIKYNIFVHTLYDEKQNTVSFYSLNKSSVK